MSKRIIGIDPGYDRCGFAVIESTKSIHWTCLTHGVITTDKTADFPFRLREIAEDLEGLLKTWKPEKLVIEDLFFAKSTTTALKVAEVRGVILMLAARYGMEIAQVKPNEVKITMTGYGRADKKQVQEMVKQTFKLKEIPKPDDAADALAVAWTGIYK